MPQPMQNELPMPPKPELQGSVSVGWSGRGLRAKTDIAALLALLLAVGLLFHTSPHTGNFWWPDAPRHAMDGAFYRDLLVSFPITHPKAWAMNYYLHYPAIVILFYPPIFALAEALFF